MLYQKAAIKNGKIEITDSKEVDQSSLTSDCFMVQFNGLTACETCKYKNKSDCGGGETLKRLKAIK